VTRSKPSHEAGRGTGEAIPADEHGSPEPKSRLVKVGIHVVGGLLGGLVGATTAVLVTELIKAILAVVSRQDTWVLILVPLVGLALSVLVLHVYHRGEALQTLAREPIEEGERRGWSSRFRPSQRDVIRADLTADVLATAGQEERFPWRLAPPRIVAIVATVGLGAPMGTESPAAHMGVAAGAFLGDRGRRWRLLARPAAVGGGAAGVAALIGNPIVGTAFILELGRRRRVPLSAERVTAALMGGLVGWGINVAFGLDLIRLNVPEVAPDDLLQGLGAALLVGAVAGTITSLTGSAIYRARGWQASAGFRLMTGGLAVAIAAVAIAAIATPAAAVGPGAGAAAWAETADAAALTLLGVALLRAAATTAAVAAGGCGGVFVPFLAIGDIAGRTFAPAFGVPSDLAGAAGAAGGIAGGYRLPFTASAMVLGLGGPATATLTCLATVAVATIAGLGAGLVLDRVANRRATAAAA
jgi:CIC family chloride channel protein